jgi:DNA-directed RNA polymerase subunit N (RpoN/RPB10)
MIRSPMQIAGQWHQRKKRMESGEEPEEEVRICVFFQLRKMSCGAPRAEKWWRKKQENVDIREEASGVIEVRKGGSTRGTIM